MADVATAAIAKETAASSTPVVKKTASKKGRKASAPKSPAAKTAKSSAVDMQKIPKVKVPADHPSYLLMVTEAIGALKDRKGASSQAIFKHISSHYHLVKEGTSEKTVRNRFGAALKKGVSTGLFNQTSGNGASGRFRMATAPKPKKATSPPSDDAPSAPSTPKAVKKAKKSVSAPSPSEKKSPKKVVAKPIAKKGKKAATIKATA